MKFSCKKIDIIIEKFKDDLLDNIKTATWSTPMGVTVATPLNFLDFEKTITDFQKIIDLYKNKIDTLFS
jgi:hypothetical protein